MRCRLAGPYQPVVVPVGEAVNASIVPFCHFPMLDPKSKNVAAFAVILPQVVHMDEK